jgi:GH24 family phage-related lysozyme (muramidase)
MTAKLMSLALTLLLALLATLSFGAPAVLAQGSGENIGDATGLMSGGSGEIPAETTDRWYVFQAEGQLNVKVTDDSSQSNSCTIIVDLRDTDGNELESNELSSNSSHTFTAATPGRYFIELQGNVCPTGVGSSQPPSYEIEFVNGTPGPPPTSDPVSATAGTNIANAFAAMGGVDYSSSIANEIQDDWYVFEDNGSQPRVDARVENTSDAPNPCGLIVALHSATGAEIEGVLLGDNYAHTFSVATAGTYYIDVKGNVCPNGTGPAVSYQLRLDPASGVSAPAGSGNGGSSGNGNGSPTSGGQGSPGPGVLIGGVQVNVNQPPASPPGDADETPESDGPGSGSGGPSAPALALVKKYEGFREYPYNDSARHCTIGYGTKLSNGPCTAALRRKYAAGISKAAATKLLLQRLTAADQAVLSAVHTRLTPAERAALDSFAYNVGNSAFANSNLVKLLNQGQTAAAADELLRWVHTNGKVSPGLVNRRQAERRLFLNGTPGGSTGATAARVDATALMNIRVGGPQGCHQCSCPAQRRLGWREQRARAQDCRPRSQTFSPADR